MILAELVADESRTLTGTCLSLAPCIRYTVQPPVQPESSSVNGLPSWGLIAAEFVICGLATTPVARARAAAANEYFIVNDSEKLLAEGMNEEGDRKK